MERTIDDLIAIIRAVDDSPISLCGFDMEHSAEGAGYTDHPCGTACCIGGHAALALHDISLEPDDAVRLFGVPLPDATAICYPHPRHPGCNAKPRHAIALLEHYRDTGIVDWDRAMEAR